MEDSETTGSIKVVVAPEIVGLMAQEVLSFRQLYPEAGIELMPGGSREAVTALLSQRADLAVVTRELEPEERSVVVKGGMELEGYRFARDAICVVVHPENPVSGLSVEELKAVYVGAITDWSQLRGRAGRIEPVVPPVNSDLMTSFTQRVMGGELPTAPATPSAGDSETVARVMRDPLAIGFVSLLWSGKGAKVLDVSSLTGLPYSPPDPELVFKGDYPLTRYFNFYVRSKGPKLANGLVTYISSLEGQKLVHEAGLVPTTVPVRFVRRSPMLSTH